MSMFHPAAGFKALMVGYLFSSNYISVEGSWPLGTKAHSSGRPLCIYSSRVTVSCCQHHSGSLRRPALYLLAALPEVLQGATLLKGHRLSTLTRTGDKK